MYSSGQPKTVASLYVCEREPLNISIIQHRRGSQTCCTCLPRSNAGSDSLPSILLELDWENDTNALLLTICQSVDIAKSITHATDPEV